MSALYDNYKNGTCSKSHANSHWMKGSLLNYCFRWALIVVMSLSSSITLHFTQLPICYNIYQHTCTCLSIE